MIVFDLSCAGSGHVFEAWFGSSEDYESQRKRGLVTCPICGDASVSKAVMAPHVPPKGGVPAMPMAKPVADAPGGGGTPPAEAVKQLMRAMAEAQRRVLATSSYVGRKFADEARAIHHGESEQRAIHGVATPDQARSLKEEGIEVSPLPFPVRPPERDN